MVAFSGVASQCEERGALPAGANFEIADTLVWQGRTFPPQRINWSCDGLSRFELSAVSPDAVQDDGDLSRDGDLYFFGSDAFDELGSPALQMRWSPNDGEKHISRLEEIRARESIAPALRFGRFDPARPIDIVEV